MMKLEDFSTDRNEIFSLYNKKEIDIKNDLILLREWMKKLPYLPSEALSGKFLSSTSWESCIILISIFLKY